MAPRVSHLLCLFLSSRLLLLPFLSQATSSGPFRRLERFGSFKHLEGSKKGDQREGIRKVKQYLQRYGYFKYSVSPQYSDNDDFDDVLESSRKAFRSFYHLPPHRNLRRPNSHSNVQGKMWVSGPPHNPNLKHYPPRLWFVGQPKMADRPDAHPLHRLPGRPPRGANHMQGVLTHAWAAGCFKSNFTFERVRDEKFAEVRVRFVVEDGPGGILAKATPLPNPEITFDKED